MKILFLYRENWEKDYIGDKFAPHEVYFYKSFEETPEEVLSTTEILSVFVSHQCKIEEMTKLPKLKLIAARSTGFDHVDVSLARSRGVEVCYVPYYGENTVAEFAFALLLNLSRKISEAHEQVTERGSFDQGNLRGFDLKDKTIGIIGTGRIGANMIRMAKGFQMNVVAYDPFPKYELSESLDFRYVPFKELLERSDIISLHAPLDEHTRYMINKDNINLMKKGVFLINTARGGLVETSALEKALEDGTIAGAGLDVLEEEKDMSDELSLLNNPNPKIEELKNVLANHYFMRHPHVIVTPHIAFNTLEAVKRILDTTIDNILSFSEGNLKNQVP